MTQKIEKILISKSYEKFIKKIIEITNFLIKNLKLKMNEILKKSKNNFILNINDQENKTINPDFTGDVIDFMNRKIYFKRSLNIINRLIRKKIAKKTKRINKNYKNKKRVLLNKEFGNFYF